MPIITDTDTLAAFCNRLSDQPFVTVDTEFIREKTYWPHLCLVQVGGVDEAWCIDPLAEGIDLAPLLELLANPNVIKVFHAARQDLEIFYKLMGEVPAPMFDTQVAAMVCGFGDSVGYEALVNKIAKEHVDKSSRFTDWSHRPLTEKQVNYALADVTHLRVIYAKLKEMLHANGRESWLDEEMAVLTSPQTYDPNLRTIWKRIKGRGKKPKMLALLRELAAWREAEAQRRDVPRNRVLRDEALMEIAHHAPTSVADLSRTRGLGRGQAEGRMGEALLKAVADGLAVPPSDWPSVEEKADLPRNIGPVVDLLRVLLKAASQYNDVATKMIGNTQDLELIAAFGEEADVAAMHGWRREIFGEDALRICDGKVAMRVVGKRVRLEPVG